ncbi:EAL domain-containing protein [Hasllibacter sp. MH4015]|uniref:sensor domain-containing phosphodiesterase n=1 Tax=Hasllibacter sp. MH4015 TaxID=2854029 RepID=UPI001CD73D23|nr:EAL domain-containing protein [Hasllibacter sp. MH4015]
MSNIGAIKPASVAVGQDIIFDALHTMRTHLQMEIAYLSEFVGDKLVFRALDAPGLEHIAQVGGTRDLSETYCNHILAGDLPELMSDTHDIPFAAAMPITKALPIRAHVSVPIERSDGSIYGMFCCLSPNPNSSLNQRDLGLMRTFARLAQSEVQRTLEVKAEAEATAALIETALGTRNFEMVYQPIFDLASGRISGMEALCRFKTDPYRAPNLWFDDAARVGKAELLEICVIETALAALGDIPPDLYLTLNASPETVATGRLAPILAQHPADRLVIEVTEHMQVGDWAALDRSLRALRDMGIRVAIDDAGAGYSGLQQMVRLKPEIIKLDRSLVDHIDEDRARRSLCAAMVHYATETGAALVAEGIERQEEVEVLRDLGVDRGQGYLLAKPMPLRELLETHHGAQKT